MKVLPIIDFNLIGKHFKETTVGKRSNDSQFQEMATVVKAGVLSNYT